MKFWEVRLFLLFEYLISLNKFLIWTNTCIKFCTLPFSLCSWLINYYHYLIVGPVSSLNEKTYDNFSMLIPSAGLCQELCIEKFVNITLFIVQVFISSRTYFSFFKCCIIINVSSYRKWYFSTSAIKRWYQLHYITVDS